VLRRALADSGWQVFDSQGTYFLQADSASVGYPDGRQLCQDLPARAGVVAIPSSAFYDDPTAGASLVRFAFCQHPEVVTRAAERLAGFGRSMSIVEKAS
jgi:N-succinyldiaminopimelate aminotransferase